MRSKGRGGTICRLTYKKGTGDQHNNAIFRGGLSVQSSKLVADLLEGKALCAETSGVSIQMTHNQRDLAPNLAFRENERPISR